jgi:hypothetical protein
MIRLAFLLLIGCAPKPYVPPASHPANPAAPTGRLAGPPPALRPGVVETPPQPAPAPAPKHEH